MTRQLALAMALAMLGTGALAADFSDPTWPCIQRKVAELSPGLMWPGPLPETPLDDGVRAEAEEIVGRLALRRIEPESVAPLLAEFTEAHGGAPETMGALFAETYERIARERRRIMTGIERYSLGQIALADRIKAARDEMAALEAMADPGDAEFDRMDVLEEQIDWDERIYNDRRQSLTYVCETPVILEKRLYAIAKVLQEAGDD